MGGGGGGGAIGGSGAAARADADADAIAIAATATSARTVAAALRIMRSRDRRLAAREVRQQIQHPVVHGGGVFGRDEVPVVAVRLVLKDRGGTQDAVAAGDV